MNGATLGKTPYSMEYRLFRYNDGKERYLHAVGRVYFDGSGKAERLVGSVPDVTEHKKAIIAEQEQRALANALVETAAAGDNGRFRSRRRYCNRPPSPGVLT